MGQAMPVLPCRPRMVARGVSGLGLPASIIASAGRALTEPVGCGPPSFAQMAHLRDGEPGGRSAGVASESSSES